MPHDAVVLFDPDHPYADSFIAECGLRWGLHTVCLLHDSPRHRPSALRSPFVAASYTIGDADLTAVASAVARHHSVVGVLPHAEAYVTDAAALSDLLDLPHGDARVKARFRDKAALKHHLRSVTDGPRVNASCLVASSDANANHIERLRLRNEFERFVLKPNAGSGNRRIGFFDSTSTRREIDHYLSSAPPEDLIMEELIDGTEFCVNGQVDTHGRAHTLSVFRTRHTSANGRERLAEAFELVHRSTPDFDQVARYAEHVVEAAGLRASPFHLELAVDDRGPCLIEVAARLGGAGMAYDTAVAHGNSLNVFATAASDYLARPRPSDSSVNWAAYESTALRTICGISNQHDRITSVDGVASVERLPEFVRWVHQPRIGQRRQPTVDLATIAWQVSIASDSEERLDEVEEYVRKCLAVNQPRRHARAAADMVRTSAVLIGHRTRDLADTITTPIPALATQS